MKKLMLLVAVLLLAGVGFSQDSTKKKSPFIEKVIAKQKKAEETGEKDAVQKTVLEKAQKDKEQSVNTGTGRKHGKWPGNNDKVKGKDDEDEKGNGKGKDKDKDDDKNDKDKKNVNANANADDHRWKHGKHKGDKNDGKQKGNKKKEKED